MYIYMYMYIYKCMCIYIYVATHLVDLLTRQVQKHTPCGEGRHDDKASAVLMYLLSNCLTLKSHPNCSEAENWIAQTDNAVMALYQL